MYEFQIPNMSCGHCVRAITQAVQSLDPSAQVQTDIAAHRVQVDTTAAREKVVEQLEAAGYKPS